MGMMDPLALVGLPPLMQRTEGRPEIVVGLIDGPVDRDHGSLVRAKLSSVSLGDCSRDAAACQHGTFIAGILAARRETSVTGICPGCTLLIRPVFAAANAGSHLPAASPEALASALHDAMQGAARIINLSLSIANATARQSLEIRLILGDAARRGVLVIAAAGNEAVFANSPLLHHPWVIPVAGCKIDGRPSHFSNFTLSVGRRGVLAPSEHITSLSSGGGSATLSGTSAAVPFVTGTLSLIWSLFPSASGPEIWSALADAHRQRRGIVPPVLNAEATLNAMTIRRGASVDRRRQ
jgi:subtilisin family serine protease